MAESEIPKMDKFGLSLLIALNEMNMEIAQVEYRMKVTYASRESALTYSILNNKDLKNKELRDSAVGTVISNDPLLAVMKQIEVSCNALSKIIELDQRVCMNLLSSHGTMEPAIGLVEQANSMFVDIKNSVLNLTKTLQQLKEKEEKEATRNEAADTAGKPDQQP